MKTKMRGCGWNCMDSLHFFRRPLPSHKRLIIREQMQNRPGLGLVFKLH